MASSREPRKSKHDALITSLIGYGVASILLVVFAIAAYSQRDVIGLRDYSLTVLLAFAIGFFSIVFVPERSRWIHLGIWLLPVSLPIVASLQGYGGGWLFGYLLGLLVAADIRKRRHKHTAKAQFSGRVMLTTPANQRRPLTASLTLTGFRGALSQLGSELQPSIALSIDGKRLDVYGTAAGPLVVYASLDAGDDFAWRRLSTPGVSDPDSEITVPVGNLNGVYRKQSTVDAKLAKQAGEYFIRTGELDPSLTWEEGQDVLDRLPPTRVRV